MTYFYLFLLEIYIIFFLSKRVQRTLSSTLMKITNNENLTIYIMAFLFLPGTFVHEMAHFLVALFLLVPVGQMHLIPVIEEDGIRLGSVSIAKTDPIRRFLIGTSPLFIGVSIILSVFSFYSFTDLLNNWIIDLFILYLVFTISNSMFSSKRDMEGLWGFLFVVFFFGVLLWFLGIRIDLTAFFIKTTEVFKTASLFLTIPILIDIAIIAVLRKTKLN